MIVVNSVSLEPRALNTYSHVHLSLIFAGKAKSQPLDKSPKMVSYLKLDSSLNHDCKIIIYDPKLRSKLKRNLWS
jgi:hypothetical protein